MGILSLTSLADVLGVTFLGLAPLPCAVFAQEPQTLGEYVAVGGADRLSAADLNQDGIVDVVSVNTSESQFHVGLGLGNGKFQSLAISRPWITGLAVADLDGDGFLDVATSFGAIKGVPPYDLGGGFQYYLGNGTGAMAAASPRDMGTALADVRAADTNGDGRQDLVLLAYHQHQVRISRGPTYDLNTLNYFGGFYPKSIAVADLDADADLDILCGTFPDFATVASTIRFLANDGQGFYDSTSLLTVSPYLTQIVLADFSGDGALDLVCAQGLEKVDLRLGLGGASFAPAQTLVPSSRSTVSVGDLDRDGRLDMAATDGSFPIVRLMFNQGGAVFQTSTLQSARGGASAIVDTNGDSWPDLIYGGRNLDTAPNTFGIFTTPKPAGIVTLLFKGPGTFHLDFEYLSAPSSIFYTTVRIAPMDGDGRPDILIYSAQTGVSYQSQVFIQDAVGGYSIPSVNSSFFGTNVLDIVDFDGDSILDAISAGSVVGAATHTIDTRKGSGTGALNNPKVSTLQGKVSRTSISTGDVNSDGLGDAVVLAEFLPPDSGSAYITLGVATAAPTAPLPMTLGVKPWNGVLCDVNDDGHLDLVIRHSTGIEVLAGNGMGSFSSATNVSLGSSIDPGMDVLVFDFTGDGRSDILTSIRPTVNGAALVLVPGIVGSHLSYASPQFIPFTPGGITPLILRMGEFNGDGSQDILAEVNTGFLPATLALIRGPFNAGFGVPEVLSLSIEASALEVADLDADGLSDVVVCHEPTSVPAAQEIVISRNRTPPQSGTTSFGSGTPGCSGTHGLGTGGAPQVGNSYFSLVSTQTPEQSLGLLLASDASLPAGADPFGLGILLHVDLFNATLMAGFNMIADEHAIGITPLPIAPNPALAGLKLHFQAIWAWGKPCLANPFGLSSSRGLEVTIQ